jgi:hypothetical protein
VVGARKLTAVYAATVRFKLHSPEAIRGIKIDWDATVELGPEIRAAMASHDVDTMRAGILVRGFALANITYPRGTIAFRVAEGHELFLQIPAEAIPPPVAKAVVRSTWTVERAADVERHRGTVGTEDDGERVDVVITTRAPSLSRTKVQRLLEQGHVTIAGQIVKKTNHRLRSGDVIEFDVAIIKSAG